ncbi:MAG: hypothetical protein JWM02_1035 [Frankiales bacterium]|nr:hypothetical protein [Frankiales bacterium]
MRLLQLTALLENSTDAIVAVDVEGRVREWNPAAEAMFGWSRREILDAPVRRSIPPEGLVQFDDVWTRLAAGEGVLPHDTVRLHSNGSRRSVHTEISAVTDHGAFAGTVATLRDLSAPEWSPTRAAGRPGRTSGRLEAAGTPAVWVLDVDTDALVNQTCGPDAGDEVLRQLRQDLAASAGRVAVEPGQALELNRDTDAARDFRTSAVFRAFREPLTVGDDRTHLTVKPGLATTGVAPAVDLLLVSDLTRGIERDELRLLFQPIVELTDNHFVGVEALVRWERPGLGLLGPVDFIDHAEDTGEIVPLGAWVAQHACHAAAELALRGGGPHTVSINLSARQLSDPGVVQMLAEALQDTGCDPSLIDIEVTETALTSDLDAATATLEAIKALGVTLALDDFGTGYSSLLYLKHFPVDRIKIDMSFVRGLGTDVDDTTIVSSTIALAHRIGVRCVAEGVETVDQLALLQQMGCDFAQGYMFSRPITLEQLHQWVPGHLPTRPRRPRVPSSYQIAPETGHILRLHAEGASPNTIAAALNQDGLRTVQGSRWTASTVGKVITRSQFPTIRLP